MQMMYYYSLTYNGETQQLGEITTNGGKVTYSLDVDGVYSETCPTKVNAGKKAVKKYTARNRGKLTGHSTRNTKLGAAKYRQNFYKNRLNKAPLALCG